MPSAVDVITYIGVPLAVLGVMPVMYTCFSALVTKYRVQRAVRKNHLTVTTRVSLLSGILEVDFPRYTIHTLSRDDPNYWHQSPCPSIIKGGSWTTLNWQKIITGKVTYRLQHSDELRQPQAEIQMSDLMTYLLDRGATPSAHGLKLLRMMALQTPPSTPLLMYGSTPVLVVATPDESEGRLSLKLQWHNGLGGRSPASLPPYWVRVNSRKVISEERYPPVRLFFGQNGLEDARLETADSRKSTADMKEGSINSLIPDVGDASQGLWFACATVAACSHDHNSMGLSRFSIPGRIQAFAKRETIPHDVLVYLGMREEQESPLQAERARLRHEEAVRQRHAALMEQQKQGQRLAALSPMERARAQSEAGMATLHKMNSERAKKAAEELDRKAEALTSPRVGNRIVAEAALDWLKKTGALSSSDPTEEVDLTSLAMSIVHAMVFDSALAFSVTSLMESWIGWMDLPMSDIHLTQIQHNQAHFCFAAVLVHAIAECEFEGRVHPVSRDLDDCQRVWGKVFLG